MPELPEVETVRRRLQPVMEGARFRRVILRRDGLRRLFPRDFAGRLIESVGLRGHRLGGAQWSELHANFVVNLGGATARDVLGLVALARARVREERGVVLEPEVRLVGEFQPGESI